MLLYWDCEVRAILNVELLWDGHRNTCIDNAWAEFLRKRGLQIMAGDESEKADHDNGGQ